MSEIKAKSFPVDAILKFKHHYLRDILQRMNWTQKQMAKYLFDHTGLKVTASQVSSWVNLSDFPRNELVMQEIESLCDLPREELFPEFLRDKNFRRMIKSFEKRIEIDPDKVTSLLRYEESFLALSPDTVLIRQERDGIIEDVLKSLSSREENVLRLRFGLGEEEGVKTLDEVAAILGLKNGESIRQIEKEALQKIRYRINSGLYPDLSNETIGIDILSLQILEQNLIKERK